MSRHELKAQARKTQKMTRDGLIERDERTGEDTRISDRNADFDLRGTVTADEPKRKNRSQSAYRRYMAQHEKEKLSHQSRSAESADDSTEPQSSIPNKNAYYQDAYRKAAPGAVQHGQDSSAPDNGSSMLNNTQNTNLQTDKTDALQFTQDESAPELTKSYKLVKAERQVERTTAKLDNAKDNLPTKNKLRTKLVFDENKGEAKREFYFEEQVKSQREHIKGALPLRPVKAGVNSAIAFGHKKMFQVEHENVGVKAGHRGELIVETGVRRALRSHKTKPYRRVSKLQHKATKKSINLSYRQALEKNPKLKSNAMSRMWQKRKIKKQYAKAARAAQKASAKSGSLTGRVIKGAFRIIRKSPKIVALLIIIGLVISVFMTLLSLGGGAGGGGLTALLNSMYLAEDEDIDAAGLAYSEWETDLRLELLNLETNHPGYDEYRREIIGAIGHDPHALMAFLTVIFHDFTFAEIESELRALFDEQHNLTFTSSVEIRTRTETRVDEEGNTYTVEVEYEWHILTVRLESIPFMDVIAPRMDEEQREHFDTLMESKGARFHVGSPFPFDWLPFVSSHYGWRVHPITGTRRLHRGVDIALPTGTEILAAHDGVVTFAGYLGDFGNVVFICNGQGIETRYAHCHTLLVSAGQTVSEGDVIATVGSTGASTGPHLHFEVLINGEHRNPVIFAFTGE